MSLRTLDLFCGGGGSSWGAQAAGAEIVCGVDAWDKAVEAFGRNFQNARAVHLEMTPDTKPSDLGHIGEIDLLLGSPECTHHSCARGSRPREEASKQTAFYVTNFARALVPRPRWIVIENVIHMRGWNGYNPLLAELQTLGYRTRVYVLDASRFGVRQTRKRVFIVGDRLADPPRTLTARRGPAPWVKGILDSEGRYAAKPLFSPGRAVPTLERAKRAIKELGREVPFLIVYYGSDGAGGWQPIDRPLRTITTLDRFGLVTWKDRIPMLRMLQVDELIAAMGFTGNYDLSGIGSRRDRIKLLGNGVCPPVMSSIIRSITQRKDSSTPDHRPSANKFSGLESLYAIVGD